MKQALSMTEQLLTLDRPVNGRSHSKKRDWREFLITTEPPAEVPLITIGRTPAATAGNHSLVIGKKKSRKSLFIVWLLSQYPGTKEGKAMLFDTEQGKRHVWKSMHRLQLITGRMIPTFYLRGQSPADRKALIEAAIREAEVKPAIVVIDGIRDLINNINDPDQTTELITWLEGLTVDHSIHVVNVLHQNKNDNNARGHLGTELANKAEITIELELDPQAGCTLVKCESSRDIPFDDFAFSHNSEGLPETGSKPANGKMLSESDERERITQAFDDEPHLKYAQLIKGIRDCFEISKQRAEALLRDFMRRGWIVKSGKDRSPETVYKLMISGQ